MVGGGHFEALTSGGMAALGATVVGALGWLVRQVFTNKAQIATLTQALESRDRAHEAAAKVRDRREQDAAKAAEKRDAEIIGQLAELRAELRAARHPSGPMSLRTHQGGNG